ncbi:MAG TPA: penicillin-binding transpeptidase domain-containing protein [Longimicrobiales bacterium]|nr:penicillin-binding transpeptidase domain-containing protein [Longimicrobiales bacterium]
MSRRMPDRLPPWRRRLVLAGLLLGAAAVLLRAGQVQIVQAAEWTELAEAQHRTDVAIEATRGSILDRDGTPLAVSRERIRVSVAPREIRDMDTVRELLREELALTRSQVAQLTSQGRVWGVAPDLYAPDVRERLRSAPGVHLERVLQRFHPHGDLARSVLGVMLEGSGRGGIEQAFESLLGGTPGREVVARDNVGREIPGERVTMITPRSGGEVVLTLDMDLQEIAQQALEEAIGETDAHGGDVVVTDPKTGEVLALVSIRDGLTTALSAVNTPYEPGSTLKPFTVASLLQRHLASMEDTVDVGEGVWEIEGRTLHDTHTEGRLSIGEALRESSNVGIAKAALALTPGAQYESLRDFGFGSMTGIELPGEVPGTLRRPGRWTAQSPASLAIGYEISVTPLQMAMAYGALANGGLLMQPRLVREVRSSTGAVLEQHQPRVIRRAVDEDVARTVARALVGVVEDGTGTSARLGSFAVAGKSGTARLNFGQGYEQGAYYSSFVGFFPADAPQLVVFVGLDRPQGAYYGGAVAAPVSRATMEAALAARTTPLDRSALLRSARADAYVMPNRAPARFAARTEELPPPVRIERRDRATGVTLPDVEGLPSRVAVRRLHALGLRVEPRGRGDGVGTPPPPGARVRPGDTVRLQMRSPDR